MFLWVKQRISASIKEIYIPGHIAPGVSKSQSLLEVIILCAMQAAAPHARKNSILS